jgi:methylmalonyl-CoA/ethylmalonyl-CoA epimerase
VILGIDHVGLAVRDAAAARSQFSRLVARPGTDVQELGDHAVRVCFVPDRGGPGRADERSGGADSRQEAALELLEPTDGGSSLARFLERRGEGLHHVCFAVDDIGAELARLTREGFRPIDARPRRGHGGLVAFLHPQSAHGVLVELLQRDAPPGTSDA